MLKMIIMTYQFTWISS